MTTMEWTSTLTPWVKSAERTTSAQISLPFDYAQKISDHIARVKTRISGNADTTTVIATVEDQIVDITYTLGISLNQSDILDKLYTFRDPVSVRTFLDSFPFLIPLLFEASPNLKRYFPEQQIYLEVISDPEAMDANQLVAIIVEISSPDEAFDRLEKFDNEWWISAVGRAKGKLCINVEFV